jgi:stage V sporulation protein R
MELIDQHSKKIMEGCKKRAIDAGLSFEEETLEYIVTNRDLLELSPKMMIPTLYDYWVHDVEVLRQKGKYELYPVNPFETVINTRPAISYYNDNNPDWLNVMIFYHVLAHIDFFQNNLFFRHTWDYDFTGEALSDKRMIAKLRSEKGRWLDYVIEFARGIDNLVGYHHELSTLDLPPSSKDIKFIDYFFDFFLQTVKKVHTPDYIKEIQRYNECIRTDGEEAGKQTFYADCKKKYPELETLFEKNLQRQPSRRKDLLQFLMENSPVLNKEEHKWMKSVLQVIRKTSIFFQPQIRTKIMNEGWASYWHENLFLQDDRIKGHEVDFARIHSQVTSMPRMGLNPYALGMKLFEYIHNLGETGKHSHEFEQLLDSHQRDSYDQHRGKGKDFIFQIRKNYCDFMLLNTFIDQDFVNQNKLFVAGKRLNHQKMVWEYFVKSRKAKDYLQMLIDSQYHPPHIEIDQQKTTEKTLYLVHHFEGKPLVREYIPNTLLGIEYLWGGPVQLETSEVKPSKSSPSAKPTFILGPSTAPRDEDEAEKKELKWQRVLYTMQDRKLTKEKI